MSDFDNTVFESKDELVPYTFSVSGTTLEDTLSKYVKKVGEVNKKLSYSYLPSLNGNAKTTYHVYPELTEETTSTSLAHEYIGDHIFDDLKHNFNTLESDVESGAANYDFRINKYEIQECHPVTKEQFDCINRKDITGKMLDLQYN